MSGWVEQMESETKIANALDHPVLESASPFPNGNLLVEITGADVLMEFVDGRTLDVIKPDAQETIRIFIHLAQGLQHMEQQGFVHCDMKPINVLVTSSGDVKIIDLGQACESGTVKKRIQGLPGTWLPNRPIVRSPRRRMSTTWEPRCTGCCAAGYPNGACTRGQNNGLTTGAVEERFLKPPTPADEVNRDVPNIVAKTIQGKRLSLIQPRESPCPNSWSVWKWHEASFEVEADKNLRFKSGSSRGWGLVG